ncbi:DM DNA binding domain protein [Aphelenchoides fujianensis]|nr:DM DNA binding domain protein [Aphelenchoides fujianensis]
MDSDGACQRFFALSKRVPKDVKRFCGICRQHGVLLETRGHVCAFKDCTCQKCELVRTRRQIMSQQIRLRRAQDKRFQRTNEPAQADVIPIRQTAEELRPAPVEDARSMCYFCQKCKNHEILVWKKQHKRQCPFTNCPCDKCELIETRRRLDQHMKKRRATAGESPERPKSRRVESPERVQEPLEAPLKVEEAFGQGRPLFVAASPEEKPAGGFRTVCIPVFVPVPAPPPPPPIDASRMSTTELLQRAAAQHFAAHAPALSPPRAPDAAPPTFLLAANPPPPPVLLSVPSSASCSPPVPHAPIGTFEPPMLVDPVMAQLLQQQTPCLDFNSCASGISNFRQLEQFLTLRTSQHSM